MKRYRTTRNVLILAGLTAMLMTAVSAMAAPIDDQGEAEGESMLSLIRKGGPVMVPLGIGSVLALALATERFISLRRSKVMPPGFMDELLACWRRHGSAQEAVDYCERIGGAVGTLFRAGILRRNRGEEAVEKAIEDAGFREADKMKRSLRGLSIIATVSPLLGLLGTVYGMISAFQTASSVGMGKADVLAKGIYEALVTTATGLTIAIPVLLIYQFLNNKVDAIVDELDEMGIEFMASWASHDTNLTLKVARPVGTGGDGE